MASLTSTGFMTLPGIMGTSLDRVDMSDVLASVLKDDTALLGQIKMKGAAKGNPHKFIEHRLNAAYFDGFTSGSTTLFVHDYYSTTAEILAVARTYAILMPGFGGANEPSYDNVDFRLQITEVSSSAITVTSYGNTAYAAKNTTTIRFYVAGMPKADVADATNDTSQARTIRSNYLQVFERGVSIEETRKHIELYAVGNELDLQTKDRTKEIKVELVQSLLNGYAYYSGGSSGDLQLRTMAGIVQLIRDPALSGTVTDETVENNSGLALTDTIVNDLIAKMYDRGGFQEGNDMVILVGAYQSRAISGLEKDKIRKTSKEQVRGFYANSFLSDLGYQIPVVLERWMQRDKLILLDKSQAAILPLQGDEWHLEKMSKSGRTEHYQLSGQYTFELRNANACHGLIRGLKVA